MTKSPISHHFWDKYSLLVAKLRHLLFFIPYICTYYNGFLYSSINQNINFRLQMVMQTLALASWRRTDGGE